MPQFMSDSMEYFSLYNRQQVEHNQLCFIISDGRLNKKVVRPLVIKAEEKKILYVFIIIDKEGFLKIIFSI
jgi:midasin